MLALYPPAAQRQQIYEADSSSYQANGCKVDRDDFDSLYANSFCLLGSEGDNRPPAALCPGAPTP